MTTLDLVLELIDAELNEIKHYSMVDGDRARNSLLDIRQLLVRDQTADAFWGIVAE